MKSTYLLGVSVLLLAACADHERTPPQTLEESVTGPIIFAETPLPGSSLDFNSHSGRIELFLPKTAAEIDAATMTGAIENSYTKKPAIGSRDKRGQEIGIGIGNGGPRYYVRSFKGTIALRSIFEFKK